jgi:hypothetical protein
VLLRGNPVEDARHLHAISAVIKRGTHLDGTRLDDLMDDIAHVGLT